LSGELETSEIAASPCACAELKNQASLTKGDRDKEQMKMKAKALRYIFTCEIFVISQEKDIKNTRPARDFTVKPLKCMGIFEVTGFRSL
jgi:hypothetical protein